MSELVYELKTVNVWQILGIYLGLDNTAADKGLIDMLHRWLQSDSNRSYVVSALRKMEQNRVADRIKDTYCDGGAAAGNTIMFHTHIICLNVAGMVKILH